MASNTTSVRLGADYFGFDSNLNKNIIKAEGEDTSQPERASLLVKFFKTNNPIYLEFIEFIVKEQGGQNA